MSTNNGWMQLVHFLRIVNILEEVVKEKFDSNLWFNEHVHCTMGRRKQQTDTFTRAFFVCLIGYQTTFENHFPCDCVLLVFTTSVFGL